MKTIKKIAGFALLFIGAAAFAVFNFLGWTQKSDEIKAVSDANRAETDIQPAAESLSATEACPELFAQSTEDYLAKAEQNQNDNDQCFVTGCGGIF